MISQEASTDGHSQFFSFYLIENKWFLFIYSQFNWNNTCNRSISFCSTMHSIELYFSPISLRGFVCVPCARQRNSSKTKPLGPNNSTYTFNFSKKKIVTKERQTGFCGLHTLVIGEYCDGWHDSPSSYANFAMLQSNPSTARNTQLNIFMNLYCGWIQMMIACARTPLY